MKSKIMLLLPLVITIFGNFGSRVYTKEVSYIDNLVNKIKIPNIKKKLEPSSSKLLDSEVANLGLLELKGFNNLNYSIKSFVTVSDLEGNDFLYINYDPCGYSVIDLKTYTTIEIDPFSKNEISVDEGDIYYPIIGIMKNSKNDTECIDKIGNVYQSLDLKNKMKKFSTSLMQNLELRKNETTSERINYLENKKLEMTRVDNGKGGDGNFDWVIDINKREVKADIEVPYSWFFKHNYKQFSRSSGGSNGICEYVAFLMIMSYYDFFISKGYFSEHEINSYVTTIRGNSYKNAIPNVSDKFVYDLFVKNNKKETLNLDDLGSLFSLFMTGKNTISAKCVNAYWLFGNPKDVINKGRPDMLCGYFPDIGDRGSIAHNIVAYGYFNKGQFKNKFLTHYGWDGKSQCIVDRGVFKTGYDWSIIDSTTNKQDRYIFDVNGTLKCGRYS